MLRHTKDVICQYHHRQGATPVWSRRVIGRKKGGGGGGKKLSPGSSPISGSFRDACHACGENPRAISPGPTCSMRVFLTLPSRVQAHGYRKYLTWLNNGTHRSVTSDWYHMRRDDAASRLWFARRISGYWSSRRRLIATSVSLEGLTHQTFERNG